MTRLKNFKSWTKKKSTSTTTSTASTTTSQYQRAEQTTRMSAEPEVAPYGGFMVKSLEEETKQLNDLTNHQYEITTLEGKTETIRPESLKIIGVDNLSTKNIENYINYYINYNQIEYEEVDLITNELIKGKKFQLKENQDCIDFKIEWINDESVNVTFRNIQDSNKVLKELRMEELKGSFEDEITRDEYLKNCIIETPAKSYNPIIEFEKIQNLNGSNETKQEGVDMEEDESSIELIIRQSFQSDRKVKNAREYSRYYLIHGEPERTKHHHHRHHQNGRRSYRERDSYRPRRNNDDDDDEEDLFADKLGKTNPTNRRNNHVDEEEDLFADKLKHANRDRSPTR